VHSQEGRSLCEIKRFHVEDVRSGHVPNMPVATREGFEAQICWAI
jgi:hypothetical protein